MDPAIAALDFAKAGAILADMVESFLAAATTLQPPEGADHDDDGNKDRRTAQSRVACIYIRQSTPGQVRFRSHHQSRVTRTPQATFFSAA
jgi:hypothetical protein